MLGCGGDGGPAWNTNGAPADFGELCSIHEPLLKRRTVPPATAKIPVVLLPQAPGRVEAWPSDTADRCLTNTPRAST